MTIGFSNSKSTSGKLQENYMKSDERNKLEPVRISQAPLNTSMRQKLLRQYLHLQLLFRCLPTRASLRKFCCWYPGSALSNRLIV